MNSYLVNMTKNAEYCHTNLLVCCHSSRLYLTGTWRRFSNSNAGSTLSSLPAAFRNAFVQRTFRGFRFFLNALWHLARQNRNTYNKVHNAFNNGKNWLAKSLILH